MPGLLDGLDRTQRTAVTHRGGPLLVLGGPGTGKTHVAVHRAAWLIEEGAAPSGVLLAALSRPAATDARVRLESVLDVPYDELSVFAVEDLCERILRDEALEAGLDPPFAPGSAPHPPAPPLHRLDDPPLRPPPSPRNPPPRPSRLVPLTAT